MNNYSNIAPVYDRVIGDRSRDINSVLELIRQEHPSASSLLDIGCGTGVITERLGSHYSVAGVDISPEMIGQAQSLSKDIDFRVGDMTELSLDEKYDCSICLFNAINQVTDLEGWEKAFNSAAGTLNPGGMYLFDVNTISKHEKFVEAGPFMRSMDDAKYEYILKLETLDQGYLCSVTVFEQQEELYKRYHNTMKCNAFPISDVLTSLEKYFTSAKAVQSDGSIASEEDDVVYFIARC